MNNSRIKIFKRQAQTLPTTEISPKITVNPLKTARQTTRDITETVAGWIAARRVQNRLEETAARRIILDESAADKKVNETSRQSD